MEDSVDVFPVGPFFGMHILKCKSSDRYFQVASYTIHLLKWLGVKQASSYCLH